MIKIMTDTTASLTKEEYKSYNITPIPLFITNDRIHRKDLFEIFQDDFYKQQREGSKYSTRHLEVDEFVNAFRPVVEMGHEIICILLSSNISPCVEKANEAKQILKNYNITIIDSKQSGFGQAYMAIKAKELADRGANRDMIVKTLEDIRSRTHTYFIVETLDHLKAGGRFFWDQAMIASLLRIKPVIWFDRNGKMKINNKISTINQVRERILLLVKECTKRKIEKIVLHYGDNLHEATNYAKELEAITGIPISLVKLSPIIGAHTGPDLLGPCVITQS